MLFQVDSGTEKYLPWARRKLEQLRALRADLGVPAMSKALSPESGVLLFLKATDTGADVLRLTGGASRFPIFAALPSTRPSRALYAKMETLVTYNYFGQALGPANIPHTVRIFREGSDGSLQQLAEFIAGWVFSEEFGVWVGGYQLLPGPKVAHWHGPIYDNGEVITVDSTLVWDGSGNTPITSNKLTAYSSDGLVAATQFGDNWGTQQHSTPYRNVPWAGGPRIDVVGNTPGGLAVVATANVALSPDIIAPLTEAPPALWSTPELQARWATDYAAGVARRKAFYKTESDDTLKALREGTFALPPRWDYELKIRAPASVSTKRPTPMAEAFSDEVLGDTSANLTVPGTKVIERRVSLTYTLGEEVRSTEVVGKVTVTRTNHVLAAATTPVFTSTYENWYEPVTGASPGIVHRAHHQFGPMVDSGNAQVPPAVNGAVATPKGLGTVWNGSVSTSFYRPDSSLGGASDPIHAGLFVPPLPAQIDTLAPSTHPFVLAYHDAAKPVFEQAAPDAAYRSAALMPGMHVRVVLFAPVIAGESLGIFSLASDRAAGTIAEVEVYGTIRLEYDYPTGKLTPSWVPLRDAAGSVLESRRVPMPAGASWPEANAAVYYHQTPWKNLRDLAASYFDDNSGVVPRSAFEKAVDDALKPA